MLNNRSLNLTNVFLVIFCTLSIFLTFQFDWWSVKPLIKFYWWSGAEPINNWYLIGLGVFFSILKIFKQDYIKFILIILGAMYILVATLSPIFAVGLIWITAYLTGRFVVDSFRLKLDINPVLFCIVGMSVMGLLITISSHFRINYSQVYLFVFLSVDYLLLRRYPLNFARLRDKLKEMSILESNVNIFLGIAAVGVIFQLFISSLMPDMGHDSLSTHLTIARRVSEAHIWGFNVKEYIWSVAPMGAEMLFIPAYMFGGEDAIRLLNISFLIGVGYLIYQYSFSILKSVNISIAFAISYLSLPIIYYSIGQAFVEPCLAFFIAAAFYILLSEKISWVILAIILGYAASIKFSTLVFCPIIFLIFIYDAWQLGEKKLGLKILYLALIFIAFSSTTFIYAYQVTGNPVFPLINEIFKSDLIFKEAFYQPLYINKEGISLAWKFIFNSKQYGEFSSNGTLGIFFSIFIPVSIILLTVDIKKKFKFFMILLCISFYVVVIFNMQAYLRYIFSALSIIFFISIASLRNTEFNKKILLIVLGFVIIINFLKSSEASSGFRAAPLTFYLSDHGRQKYVAKFFPFAPIGELLRIYPEFDGKKILLIGYGVDPMYFHYPPGTVSYSWHSIDTFDTINQSNGDIRNALKKMDIEIIVCQNNQHADDKFLFSDQCKNISTPIATINGVYVGRVN